MHKLCTHTKNKYMCICASIIIHMTQNIMLLPGISLMAITLFSEKNKEIQVLGDTNLKNIKFTWYYDLKNISKHTLI